MIAPQAARSLSCVSQSLDVPVNTATAQPKVGWIFYLRCLGVIITSIFLAVKVESVTWLLRSLPCSY
jgi:hypothetical protein